MLEQTKHDEGPRRVSMSAFHDIRSKENMEQYLQDLICIVSSPEEVGLLIDALLVLQSDFSGRETTRARAAGV